MLLLVLAFYFWHQSVSDPIIPATGCIIALLRHPRKVIEPLPMIFVVYAEEEGPCGRRKSLLDSKPCRPGLSRHQQRRRERFVFVFGLTVSYSPNRIPENCRHDVTHHIGLFVSSGQERNSVAPGNSKSTWLHVWTAIEVAA